MTPSTPMEPNAPLTNQKGITALNVAIAGVVLVGMAAFAIDVGHALVTQNELQNAADAAALGRASVRGHLFSPPG